MLGTLPFTKIFFPWVFSWNCSQSPHAVHLLLIKHFIQRFSPECQAFDLPRGNSFLTLGRPLPEEFLSLLLWRFLTWGRSGRWLAHGTLRGKQKVMCLGKQNHGRSLPSFKQLTAQGGEETPSPWAAERDSETDWRHADNLCRERRPSASLVVPVLGWAFQSRGCCTVAPVRKPALILLLGSPIRTPWLTEGLWYSCVMGSLSGGSRLCLTHLPRKCRSQDISFLFGTQDSKSCQLAGLHLDPSLPHPLCTGNLPWTNILRCTVKNRCWGDASLKPSHASSFSLNERRAQPPGKRRKKSLIPHLPCRHRPSFWLV